MKAYYAARAKEYDKIYLKPERQTDLRAIEQWLAPKFEHASVLEIAAGTGYWTQFIAPVAQSLVALDASSETFDVARSRLAGLAVPVAPVQWLIGDAYAIPQPTQLYDAAFAGFWYSHIPVDRQREFLRGLHRVLKPGAKVVFLDNLFVEGSSTPLSETDAQGNTYQTRPLADGSTHRLLKNFPTENQLIEVVQGIGKDLVYTAWPYFWAFEYNVLPE
jgi:demethylmenaquinone methyltransferase/2-methoxy-6-polyprenyl-1,4-benzoquinol methylase